MVVCFSSGDTHLPQPRVPTLLENRNPLPIPGLAPPTPYVVFERGRGTSRGGIAPLLVEERTRWLQTDFPSVGRSVVSARGGGITHSSTAAPAAGSVAIPRYGRVLRRGIRPGLGVSSRPTVTQWGIDQRLLLAYGKYPHLTAEPECKSWRFHPFVSARGWPPYSQGGL